jgi:hypothetical protein
MTVTDQLLKATRLIEEALKIISDIQSPIPATWKPGPVTDFLESGLIDISDPTAKTRCLDLYNTYYLWCSRNSTQPLYIGYFAKALRVAGLTSYKASGGVCFRGIKPSSLPNERSEPSVGMS